MKLITALRTKFKNILYKLNFIQNLVKTINKKQEQHGKNKEQNGLQGKCTLKRVELITEE